MGLAITRGTACMRSQKQRRLDRWFTNLPMACSKDLTAQTPCLALQFRSRVAQASGQIYGHLEKSQKKLDANRI